MYKKITKVIFLLVAGSVLAACSLSIGETHYENSDQPSVKSEYSSNDLMFAQMMIPHHEQAVEMSQLAFSRSENPAVSELAKQILQEQTPEILLMQGWLDTTGASMEMHHDMGMGGMLSNEQMEQLSTSSGSKFDELYLEGMIQHHQGAIEMAEMVINSENGEVKSLAEAIIKSQTEQISYMRDLLSQL